MVAQNGRAKARPVDPVLRELMKPPRTTVGKLSGYRPDIAERIVDRIWRGESLAAVCRSETAPASYRTVTAWMQANPEFKAAYKAATKAQAALLIEDAMSIADDVSRDRTGEGMPDSAAVQRAKLRVNLRTWLAAKLDPAYAAKVEHAGEVRHTHMIDRPPDETREQWIARRKAELAQQIEGVAVDRTPPLALPDGR